MFGNKKHTCWSVKLWSSFLHRLIEEWTSSSGWGECDIFKATHSPGTLRSRWAVISTAYFMFSVNTCAAEGLQRLTDTVYFRLFYLLPKSLVCTGLLSGFTLLGLCCSKVFNLGNYQTFSFLFFFFSCIQSWVGLIYPEWGQAAAATDIPLQQVSKQSCKVLLLQLM